MIKVENLSKVYKSSTKTKCLALNDISFTLGDKGMVFVCGKSGSGKSTLLNMLAGLDSFTSGEIIFDGIKFSEFKPMDYDNYRNTSVGFIFQDFYLMDSFDVEENIRISLDLQDRSDDQAIKNILTQVDLNGLENRYPNELSGGQKQRVAIARALVKKPRFILADEPTGNLDSKTSKQILNLLKEISRTKLVVVVSHSIDDATKYADRIIELSDGEIISDLTRKEIKSYEVIEGNTITLPIDRTLTKKELLDINRVIRKKNSKIKQACSDFVSTKEIEYVSSGNRPTNSKGLSLKRSLSMVKNLTKGHTTSLIITSIIASLLIVILGFSQLFTMFNPSSILSNALNITHSPSFVLFKGYSEEEKYKTIQTDRLGIVTDEEITEFYKSGYTGKTYKLYNTSMPIDENYYASNIELFRPNNSKNFSDLYTRAGYGVLDCDIDYLTNLYGIDGSLQILAGSLDPEFRNYGVVITDYLADSFLSLNKNSIVIVTENPYEYFTDTINSMWHNTFTIKAVINTNYKERYASVFEKYSEIKNEAKLSESKQKYKELIKSQAFQNLYDEITNYLAIGYYVSDINYVENIISNAQYAGARARFTNATILDEDNNAIVTGSQTTVYKEYSTHLDELNDINISENEAYIGATLYNSIFGTNCSFKDQSEFRERTITIRNYNTIRGDDDLPSYTLNLTVRGLTKNDECGFLVDSEIFNHIKRECLTPHAIYFDNPSSAFVLDDIANEYNYYVNQDYFKQIYNINKIVSTMIDSLVGQSHSI